jgi:1-acyl-sn-glycerol-3-phosphate acyltransferase
VIFPEGTRARRSSSASSSRARTQLRAAAAVLPVVIDGSWRLLRHNLMPVPFGVRVRVSIAEPIQRRPGDDSESLLEQVEGQIRATLDHWRRQRAEARRMTN